MKKIILNTLSTCIAVCLISSAGAAFATENDNESSGKNLNDNCKSAYLCDYNSGECIYKFNELQRLPIASVCKVMTLNLCFDAIDSGELNIDEKVLVSENAAGMGGSQVFLQSGLSYDVSELIKSIIVCSANDSCVAISEAVCGSEDAFVAKMNRTAEEYGCVNTLFSNCTGLPKDTQYSCAKDVAIMFSHLISRNEYFEYSKIWLEDFVHPDNRTTTITNTNKLIRKYSYCDGGKTGFTNQAGFCLASTAKKDNLRLVSVVLGADNSNDRFSSAISMFDYGFGNYKNAIVLDKEINLNESVNVIGGKKQTIEVHPSDYSYVFTAKNAKPDITFKFLPAEVKAPVSKGDFAGKIEVYKDGIMCDVVDAVASEDCEKTSFGDNFRLVAENWIF